MHNKNHSNLSLAELVLLWVPNGYSVRRTYMTLLNSDVIKVRRRSKNSTMDRWSEKKHCSLHLH